MSKSFNPLSLRIDRPLDLWTMQILSAVNEVFQELNCRYMLIGATARDLLLFHVFGRAAMRATRDVDFAIAVESWERFAVLVRKILDHPKFQASEIEHRVFFRPSEAEDRVPVDIVPFGGVTSAGAKIHWPGDAHMVMSVAGFEDAIAAAVWVCIDHDLTIPVVSLPGLALLKLFAWADRRAGKDATDLHRILMNYADAGNEDRFYSDKLDLLERAEFDMELAGAHLLALDVVELCHKTTLQELKSEFASLTVIEKLENQMVGQALQTEERVRRIAVLVESFFTTLLGTAVR